MTTSCITIADNEKGESNHMSQCITIDYMIPICFLRARSLQTALSQVYQITKHIPRLLSNNSKTVLKYVLIAA